MKTKHDKIRPMKGLNIVIMACLMALSMLSCTEDIADVPEITTFINGVEATTAEVSDGEVFSYRFDVQANTTIADLKMIVFDVLTPEMKQAKQTLVAGVPEGLEETIEGKMTARTNTELMLIVQDVDGNEVASSLLVTLK